MLNYLFTNPFLFILYAFALLVAVTIHEFSHAWTSDQLGDPTARLAGRLSLNPLVHIDMMGLFFLLLIGFGWGKPVPFDAYNLKNPRKDAALISFAGPVSNLILATVCSIILRLMIFFKLPFLLTLSSLILTPIIYLNCILGIFNLLPIAPLDGFKIVGGFLSDKNAQQWYQLERYGLIFLLLLIIPLGGSSMLDLIIRPIINLVLKVLIPSSLGGGLI